MLKWSRKRVFMQPHGEHFALLSPLIMVYKHKNQGQSNFSVHFLLSPHSTGWPITLFPTSCRHQNKGSVLVWGSYTKTYPLFWCQTTWMVSLPRPKYSQTGIHATYWICFCTAEYISRNLLDKLLHCWVYLLPEGGRPDRWRDGAMAKPWGWFWRLCQGWVDPSHEQRAIQLQLESLAWKWRYIYYWQGCQMAKFDPFLYCAFCPPTWH